MIIDYITTRKSIKLYKKIRPIKKEEKSRRDKSIIKSSIYSQNIYSIENFLDTLRIKDN